jgi:hypothetical protein
MGDLLRLIVGHSSEITLHNVSRKTARQLDKKIRFSEIGAAFHGAAS